MKVGDTHLTYCTNIHPGESWADVRAALQRHTLAVKAAVCPDAPFGVGLRLSARAAAELLAEDHLPRLRSWLRDHGLYVFTLNGFPYGPFHGTAVKEAVYRPDWSEPERGAYTHQLATVLAALAPDGGTISTVPGSFLKRPFEVMANNLVDQAVALWRRVEAGGPPIALCLEPEPCCVLETTAQTVAFFTDHLFGRDARRRFVDQTGVDKATAEAGLRRHLAVCLDTCHAAVEFEDPRGCVDALRAAGIRIGKVQVTTGLHVDDIEVAADRLAEFADPIYLHQVVVSGARGLTRFVDLAPALQAHREGTVPAGPWRVHFHIPVFLHALGPFTNTDGFVDAVLREVDCDQFEVETYTWDVLPPEHRSLGVAEAIARELLWTRGRMAR